MEELSSINGLSTIETEILLVSLPMPDFLNRQSNVRNHTIRSNQSESSQEYFYISDC